MLVRMTFQPDKVTDFLAIFRQSQPLIRAFEGCVHLELLQDAHNLLIYNTLSHWNTAEALEAYRQSALFRETWARTKVLFADKPRDFSLLPVTL